MDILLIVVLAAVVMLLLAVTMSFILGWAKDAFHVEVDPRVEQVDAALPGANCGGCGYVGCSEYAEAVVLKNESADKCPVGGASCAEHIAEILGIELEQSWPYRAVVHCGATREERLGRTDYLGEGTCAGANLINGVQGCTYGCLGFGDCQTACPFDAIHVIDGLAMVDYDKCTGCGKCEDACPRHIISMVPFKAAEMIAIQCSNKDFGKEVKAVCKVGCIGCGACARVAEGLFEIEDNLPSIHYDRYDPAKLQAAEAAIEKCPMKRVVHFGAPSEADLAKVADEDAPDVVKPNFKTTVDDTEWHG